jgi:isoamyl acetate esterase
MQEDGGPVAAETPERQNSVTAGYAEACKEVAASLGIPVLDLWTLMMGTPAWQTFLTDGLHFTTAGQRLLYEALQSVIDEHVPSLRCVAVDVQPQCLIDVD